MKRNGICIIIGLLFLFGCAHVDFYSDEGLKKETGLRYYIAKPYLLVARTGAKDKPLEVSAVYLPDLENPQYAVYHSGWGSHQFSITVSNGILTSYGQNADSKIPETISAIGSLASSAGGAYKSIAEMALKLQALDVTKLANAAKQLEEMANDLGDAMKTVLNMMTTDQKNMGAGLQATLKSLAARLKDPQATMKLQEIADDLIKLGKDPRWDKLIIQGSPNDNVVQVFNSKIRALKDQSQTIANQLNPPVPTADFELYEIKQVSGKTTLIRVEGVSK